ncbi:MAG: subclass B3 metallo-beta-lactamase [Maricaulaceae bacterium]|jgi:metallo-beta-lactamase class B
MSKRPKRILRRSWLFVALGVFVVGTATLFVQWKSITDHGGQQPAAPFRIAGSLYYVGANDVTSFLLAGPEGHVLIDGGYPGTAAMIIDSIEELGFNIEDVRILLNTHWHFDHAGGLAALQDASGAELWVSEPEADVIEAGGDSPDAGLWRLVIWSGLIRYPAPHVDHRFTDGETVRLGPIELTAHITSGHTPGCTSWSFPVRDRDRELHVVHICGISEPIRFPLSPAKPNRAFLAEYQRTFETLRSLEADIFLAPHARHFGRWPKYQESLEAEDPVAPFIDPEGYLRYIDEAEARVREALGED